MIFCHIKHQSTFRHPSYDLGQTQWLLLFGTYFSICRVMKFLHFGYKNQMFKQERFILLNCHKEENGIYYWISFKIVVEADRIYRQIINSINRNFKGEHSHTTSDVFWAFLTYIPSYLPQNTLLHVSLFGKVRCSLTQLPMYLKI